jgi:uncharacterized membrane protein SpoIIM required for sporulation/uncharacterized RDD family membrane protein YckC
MTPSGRTASAAAARGQPVRQVQIVTAERVPLTLPLAGLGERAIASFVDALLLFFLVVALLFVYTFWGRGDLEQDVSNATRWTVALIAGGFLVGLVLYDVAFDVLGGGRTPGKRLVGLRVVDGTGHAPDLLTSLLRNLLRLVDILPVGYGVGTVVLFFTGSRRFGDLVAGTVVISERARGPHPFDIVAAAAGPWSVAAPAWHDDHVLRALDFVVRTAGLAGAPADSVCARILSALPAVDGEGLPARARLAAAIIALSGDGGVAARLRHLRDREHALRMALDALRGRAPPTDGGDIGLRVDTAARAAASELLAAVRRAVPPRLLESVSLALLEVERVRRPPPARTGLRLRRFLTVDVPSAVWSERDNVVRVAAVFGCASAVGFLSGWADADVARALVGDDLAVEIERGASWTNAIERGGDFAATSIHVIVNNVGVGLRVFALGVLGGVATLLGVAYNGVALGAVFGYAVQLGTAATLARFLVAHGPVELSMICVAGAAGLCLGRAILSPGRRSRLHALRAEGARGLRLVTFATIGFTVIGTVEGFVSPGQHFPMVVNVAVGGILWLLFFGWARSGMEDHAQT